MGTYREIEGDLIKMAKTGAFDVIAHGCNCFCTMGAGIAPQMAKAFGCDSFPLELKEEKTSSEYILGHYTISTGNEGDINKLGQIDYKEVPYSTKLGHRIGRYSLPKSDDIILITVVNCYTQYGFGSNHENGTSAPLDPNALILCFKKINHIFKGKKVGLPQIGCGLAGGNWGFVKTMIQLFLKDCDTTVVIYKPS